MCFQTWGSFSLLPNSLDHLAEKGLPYLFWISLLVTTWKHTKAPLEMLFMPVDTPSKMCLLHILPNVAFGGNSYTNRPRITPDANVCGFTLSGFFRLPLVNMYVLVWIAPSCGKVIGHTIIIYYQLSTVITFSKSRRDKMSQRHCRNI